MLLPNENDITYVSDSDINVFSSIPLKFARVEDEEGEAIYFLVTSSSKFEAVEMNLRMGISKENEN